MSPSNNKNRIFLSYGHDRYAAFAVYLQRRLEEHGYPVWFDLEQLKPGKDWELYIERGLTWAAEPGCGGHVVLLMTPHSVRRPDGYCLNELARAITYRIPIIPIQLAACEPPLSIARIQRLDMQGCAEEPPTKPFEPPFMRLRDALEGKSLDDQGAESRLLLYLAPPDFSADIRERLQEFVGREWIFSRIRQWLDDPAGSRLFWITGAPGVGKSALAAQIGQRFPEVSAFHACVHGNADKGDPRRVVMSIAFQLATQLPDYLERVSLLDLPRICSESNAQTLMDSLLVQPLSSGNRPSNRAVVVVIDALDEVTQDGKNDLARFVVKAFSRLPREFRLIATSRAEAEVEAPLQGLSPYVLEADSAENLDDLRAFLSNRLPQLSKSPVTIDAIERIIERSAGVFLYAVWVVRELQEGRLSLERVDAFPEGLGGIYLEFFHRQFCEPSGKRSVEAYRHRYRPVLELIVSAAEYLSVDYIASVLGWGPYDTTEVLTALGSLFPVRDGTIRAFHFSVVNWLQDPKRAGELFLVDVRSGHRRHYEWGWTLWWKGEATRWSYVVNHLPMHILQASVDGWRGKLKELLLDFHWLIEKLRISDASAIVRVFEMAAEDPTCRDVSRAIRFAAHIINDSPDVLPQQLFGRVVNRTPPEITHLLAKARASCKACDLLPTGVSLAEANISLGAMRGHEAAVTCVDLSSNGSISVSGSSDTTLRVWDLTTGEERHALRGHSGPVACVALSLDGRTAVSGSEDNSLWVWDIPSGIGRVVLRGHRKSVNKVALHTDRSIAVSASDDRTLRVWDLATGRELRVLRGHQGPVNCVAIAADGLTAVSTSNDHTVRVWELATGRELHILRGHEKAVDTVALSRDGKLAVSASRDRTLRVWDLHHGKECRVLSGHIRKINPIAISANGKYAVSGSDDWTLRVWDLNSGDELHLLRGHRGPITCVAFGSGDQTVVSAGHDARLRVWDMKTGQERGVMEGHSYSIECMALSTHAESAVSGSRDGTIRYWNLAAETGQNVESGHKRHVDRLAVAVEAKVVVSAGIDRTLRVWNLETGEQIKQLSVPRSRIIDLCASTDGQFVLTLSVDNSLRLWDIDKGKRAWVQLANSDDPGASPDCIAMSADGRVAVSGSYDGNLQIWDLTGSGSEHRKLRGHDRAVRDVALSANGETAVSVSDDGFMRVWNVRAGRVSRVLRVHESSVPHVALNRAGNRAVAVSYKGGISLWNVVAGTNLHTWPRHGREVTSVALSEHGKTALFTTLDHALELWDLETGQCISSFKADGSIRDCGALPDFSIIVATGDLGQIHNLRRADDPWFDRLSLHESVA